MAERSLEYNATIIERADHTKELATFTIRYDDPLPKTPAFLAGQYVALGLNNEKVPAKGSVRRSMSIAGAPTTQTELDFYVRYVSKPESENPLTHLLWQAKAGDRIFATRKPVGKFTLEATLGEGEAGGECPHILMVAAGTGLAPFVGMVRDALHNNRPQDLKRFILLHGASYPDDLCYRDELTAAAEKHGLHYFTTVSRARENPSWTGDKGRVEDYLLPERLEAIEAAVGVPTQTICSTSTAVLICGLQGTIARCIERLAKRGFVPFDRKIRNALGLDASTLSSMWWEQYDTSPVIDLSDPSTVETLRSELLRARNR